jgi:hypothetical protein
LWVDSRGISNIVGLSGVVGSLNGHTRFPSLRNNTGRAFSMFDGDESLIVVIPGCLLGSTGVMRLYTSSVMKATGCVGRHGTKSQTAAMP